MSFDDRLDDLLPPLPPEPSKPLVKFNSLLAGPGDLKLTKEEENEFVAFNTALAVLGPAGGSVMVCPGNQIEVPDEKRCAYHAKCPLLRAQKAPKDKLCPIERNLVEERFGSWCRTIDVDPMLLTEDARVAVADLVWIDLQEQRSVHILATGEAARLTQTNISESVNWQDEAGVQQTAPLAWERVLHVNTQRLDQLMNQRRMILKDWMLTPEQQWKKARAEGKASGLDLGSQQSKKADALRTLDPKFED